MPSFVSCAQSVFLRSLLTAGALLSMCSLSAVASPISIGVVSYDEIVPANPPAPGVDGFTIYNFTGSNISGDNLSALSFLNASMLLNGSSTVTVSDIGPGSVQPSQLDFPDSTSFTDAVFTATLSSPFFTLDGASYEAASTSLVADLTPSSGPDLTAGVDFAVITINASPAVSVTSEPASLWLFVGALPGLLLVRTLSPRFSRAICRARKA